MISLTMLLAARLRDLQEARDSERVLQLRVVRPDRRQRKDRTLVRRQGLEPRTR